MSLDVKLAEECATTTPAARSLFRIVGGKSRIADRIAARVRPHLAPGGRYVEPFAGSASVALHLGQGRTTLCDDSEYVYLAWRSVRDEPEALIREVERLREKDYYALRDIASSMDAGVRRAAAFLLVQARCFNGVLRVNVAGRLNVPVGKIASPRDPSPEEIRDLSLRIKNWTILHWDFQMPIRGCVRGGAIYADPPYAGGFSGYTPGGFSEADRIRLAEALAAAARRGAYVLATDSVAARGVYEAAGLRVAAVDEPRSVSRDGGQRGWESCVFAEGGGQ